MKYKSFISLFIIACTRAFTRLFYKTEITWLTPQEQVNWRDVKIFVFLNHTSLFEPLFLNSLPWPFIYKNIDHTVVPGADKTLNRPLVGKFFKALVPNMISISRKRDHTWDQFIDKIKDDALVVILPEGRMMRKNGMDLAGNPMTVRGGIADILEFYDKGTMLIAYSGGLHHVQAPGELKLRLFQKLEIAFEFLDINNYKDHFKNLNREESKKAIIDDLQNRLSQNVPGSKI